MALERALASLRLEQSSAAKAFALSPRKRSEHHPALALRRVGLFSAATADTGSKAVAPATEHVAAVHKDGWNAITGDLFQTVIEHLPAHTAQHAMLVCRQWHYSIVSGLVHLKPQVLRLDSIQCRQGSSSSAAAVPLLLAPPFLLLLFSGVVRRIGACCHTCQTHAIGLTLTAQMLYGDLQHVTVHVNSALTAHLLYTELHLCKL